MRVEYVGIHYTHALPSRTYGRDNIALLDVDHTQHVPMNSASVVAYNYTPIFFLVYAMSLSSCVSLTCSCPSSMFWISTQQWGTRHMYRLFNKATAVHNLKLVHSTWFICWINEASTMRTNFVAKYCRKVCRKYLCHSRYEIFILGKMKF